MIKIKRIKFIFILLIFACFIFSGCTPEETEAVPVIGAAEDLQERFAGMFEDTAEEITKLPEPTVLPEQTTVIIQAATQATTQATANMPATTTAADPSIYPDMPEEPLFVITPSGRRYHVEGCHTARNIAERLTRAEAEARGFDPCGICNP